MSRFRFLAGGLALSLLLAGGPARAQQVTRGRASGHSSTEVRRVSEVIGAHVRLQEGGEAKVVDLVLNERGCAEFVVLSFNDRYVAVPYDFVTVDFAGRVVTVDVGADRLREAPAFDRDAFRVLAESRFRERVSRFFSDRSERRQGNRRRNVQTDDADRSPPDNRRAPASTDDLRNNNDRTGTQNQRRGSGRDGGDRRGPASPSSPERVSPPNPAGTGQPPDRVPNRVEPSRRSQDVPERPSAPDSGREKPARNSNIPKSRPEGAPG